MARASTPEREVERRRKISEGLKGRPVSTSTRAKISKANKGHVHSVEARYKISEAGKGRVPWNKGLTKETDKRLAKMGEKRKGLKFGPEARKRMSISAKNKPPQSDETKQKISRSMKKFIDSDAGRKKVNAMRGQPRKSWGKGGIRADLGMYFRSRWESNVARYLDFLIKHSDVHTWEYEPETFEFPVKRGNKYYVPDFRVTFKDGRQEYWEVKGYWDRASKVKVKRFRKFFPDETLVVVDKPAYLAIERDVAAMVPNWEHPGE